MGVVGARVDLSCRGGDLISYEAVLPGKPLKLGILTLDLKAGARWADRPRAVPAHPARTRLPGVLLDAGTCS